MKPIKNVSALHAVCTLSHTLGTGFTPCLCFCVTKCSQLVHGDASDATCACVCLCVCVCVWVLLAQLMDQAARMALTTNKNESGAVVMRLDLDQDEKEDWRPQEQMQTHTVDTHTAPPLSTVGGGGVSDVGNPADLAAAGTGAGGAAVTAGGTVAVDAGAAAAGAAVSEAETAAAAGVGACVGGTDAASQGYAAYSPRAGSYTRPDPYLKPLLLISVEELSGYSCTVEAGEVSEAMIVQVRASMYTSAVNSMSLQLIACRCNQ